MSKTDDQGADRADMLARLASMYAGLDEHEIFELLVFIEALKSRRACGA